MKKDQERLLGDDCCCPGSRFGLAKDRLFPGWTLRGKQFSLISVKLGAENDVF